MNTLENVDLAKLNLLDRLDVPTFLKVKSSSGNPKNYSQKDLKYHVKLIKSYIKNNIKAKGKVKHLYHYSETTPENTGGRLFCNTSIQGLDGIIRGYLYRDTTTDIDFKNMHPTLLAYICEKHDIRCPHLNEYNNNRDKILMQYGDKDGTKTKILTMVNSDKKGRHNDDYLNKLDKECKEIQNKLKDIDEFKPFLLNATEFKPTNILGSFINRVLCYYENMCLQCVIDVVHSQGIDICAFMFDGLLIYGNHYENEDLLKKCEEAVALKFEGSNLKLSYKGHDETLTDDILNDIEIKEEFPEYSEIDMKNMVLKEWKHFHYSNKLLYMFDDANGMYTSDKACMRTKITDILISKTGSKALTIVRLTAVMKHIEGACNEPDWLSDNANSSLGYILYKNGYYDFKQGKFYEEYTPDIVFMWGLNYDYNFNIDNDYVDSIRTRFFYEPLGVDVSDYYIEQLSRAVAGDVIKKYFLCIGSLGDNGKSTITNILKHVLCKGFSAFNAGVFIQTKSTADEAAKNRWSLLLRYCRIIASNEIDSKAVLDGNILKKHSSGGDSLQGRGHGEAETSYMPHYLCLLFQNDIGKIMPFDKAVDNRTNVISYDKRYVDSPTLSNELQKIDPKFIEPEMKTDKFKQSVMHLFIKYYSKFLLNGEMEKPLCMRVAKDDWVGESSDPIIAFRDNFIITNEATDYVESNDIQKWIDEEKLGITMKKLGVDFKAYVGVNKFDNVEIGKRMRVSGKQIRVWTGIKEIGGDVPVAECKIVVEEEEEFDNEDN